MKVIHELRETIRALRSSRNWNRVANKANRRGRKAAEKERDELKRRVTELGKDAYECSCQFTGASVKLLKAETERDKYREALEVWLRQRVVFYNSGHKVAGVHFRNTEIELARLLDKDIHGAALKPDTTGNK